MSKSLGNIIEPQLMIQKYSADALRFWAAGSKLGEDLPFMEKDLLTGQKCINKLWNASKFNLLHLDDYNPYEKIKNIEVFDRWLLSKLQKLIKGSTDSFESYEYSRTKSEVEQFFWHTFCDQYLEIVKDRLYNPAQRGAEARKSAQQGLYWGLLNILKLIAPIMPHISEEIYQLYFAQKEEEKSIHTSSWPEFRKELIDEEAELTGDLGIDIIDLVRKFKSEQKMSLKDEIRELILVSTEDHFQESICNILGDLKAVLRVKEINFQGKTTLETERFKVKVGIVK